MSLIAQPVAIVSQAVPLYTLSTPFVVSYQAVHAVGLDGAEAATFMSFTVTVPLLPFTVRTQSFVSVIVPLEYVLVIPVHTAIFELASLTEFVHVPQFVLFSLYMKT